MADVAFEEMNRPEPVHEALGDRAESRVAQDEVRNEAATAAAVNQEAATIAAGGAKVAERTVEGVFEGFNKMNESLFSVEGVKKAAAWYIDTAEKLATQAIELQEKATGWAKETPLAPLFEAQHSMARKVLERSTAAARNLWQIEA
ncbi:MAG TPA: hypothetical protein VFB15_09405 [Candidatus Binataceae bacterium]|jgi:hypothetical protein|nr:hypothetical protein [Candidatus Binataceae bacterium]